MRLKMISVMVAGALAVMWGCSMPDEPELPQWDFQLVRIPIMGPDTIAIGKELTSENLVPRGPDSLYYVTFSGSEQMVGIEFPSIEEDFVDIDFEIPDISFEDISFTFVFSDIAEDIDINLRLEGVKSDEDPVVADYSFSLDSGLETNTVVLSNTGLVVNDVQISTEAGIADVFNMLPEHISFSGSVDPPITDPIDLNYTTDMGFVFSLPEGAVLEGDTVEIVFDSEDPADDDSMRVIIREHLNNISFDFTLANGIPIGGELKLYAADSTTALSTPIESWPVLTTFSFDPAPTDEEGNITDVPDQDVSVGLTNAQVQTLSEAELAFWKVTLAAIQMGSLHSTDKIILRKSYISGGLTINSNLFDTLEGDGDNPDD